MTKNALTATLITALLNAPVLAQTMSMPAQTMSMPAQKMGGQTMSMPGMSMKGAPMFRYSTARGMNMMMVAGTLDISPVPGQRLISRSVQGRSATLIYAGSQSLAVFRYYDSAIKAEGWKTSVMDGMMTGSAAAMKSGAMNMSAGGTHSATFEMGGHSVTLNVREGGGRVTASFSSK